MTNEELKVSYDKAVDLIHKYESLTMNLCHRIEELQDSMRAQAEFNARVNEKLRFVDEMQHLFNNSNMN